MTDSAGLAGEATADYVYKNIIFVFCLGQFLRLVYDQLQGFQTKIIIHFAAVDDHFAFTRYQADTGNGRFATTSRAVYYFCPDVFLLLITVR